MHLKGKSATKNKLRWRGKPVGSYKKYQRVKKKGEDPGIAFMAEHKKDTAMVESIKALGGTVPIAIPLYLVRKRLGR